MKVLVTGANGFVGRAVCAALADRGHEVRAAIRRDAADLAGAAIVNVGEIDGDTDWRAALDGIEAVIHLAAVTHGGDLAAPAAAARYHRVNVQGTEALARQAVAAGVRRLVFMSSVKVLGEASPMAGGRPVVLSGRTPPDPRDHYGRSKLEAEQLLARFDPLEVVILRPPLVYGRGQKGNLATLEWPLLHGLPLPLAAVQNRRSLICVSNLADAAVRAVEQAGIGGRVLTLADCEVSTPQLIRALAAGLGVRPRLFRVPVRLLAAAGTVLGRRAMMNRLLGSLVVDASEARAVLGWSPAATFEAGLGAGRSQSRDVSRQTPPE